MTGALFHFFMEKMCKLNKISIKQKLIDKKYSVLKNLLCPLHTHPSQIWTRLLGREIIYLRSLHGFHDQHCC